MLLRLKKLIKAWMPFTLHQRLEAKHAGLGRQICPVCLKRVIRFTPNLGLIQELDKKQSALPLFTYETLNLLHYFCPSCGAEDRARLYVLYLREVLSKWSSAEKLKILDIAPSPALTKFLKRQPNVCYRSADLYNPHADDQVDVMDMRIYPDQTYDFVICSHVLEHVSDDLKALKEIYRVMKPNAQAIIMVPIDLSRETIDEDPSVTDETTRWHRFGQGDHVRLYSQKGFIQRMTEAGFVVNQLGCDYFGEEKFRTHGIHHRSILYLVEKKTFASCHSEIIS